MKALKFLAGILIAGTATVVINSGNANANTAACTIEAVTPVSIYEAGKNFTYDDAAGTVTGTFKVTGPADCRKQAVLAVWVLPNATGQPWESQTFYDYAPKTATSYGPGVHTITAKLPKCEYWQLDLLEGTDPRGINGTAWYGPLTDPISPDNSSRAGYRRNFIDTKIGGMKKDCSTPPKDECPNLPEMQNTVPAGYTKDKDGNCIIVTVDQPEPPKELPKTGAGSLIATVTSVTGLGYVASRLKQRFSK